MDVETMKKTQRIRMRWNVAIKRTEISSFSKGYIVAASLRYYGGLHTRLRNSKATLAINERPIDGLRLRWKPKGHSDYFHQIPLPEGFPKVKPFADCRTVYAWPILKAHLKMSRYQKIEIEIDGFVNWDIDYIGLVLERPANP